MEIKGIDILIILKEFLKKIHTYRDRQWWQSSVAWGFCWKLTSGNLIQSGIGTRIVTSTRWFLFLIIAIISFIFWSESNKNVIII